MAYREAVRSRDVAAGLPAQVSAPVAPVVPRDDLSRDVYGVMGIPVDAVTMPEVLAKIRTAAEIGEPFLLSTPNLNFLIASQSSAEFRTTLLHSDLCPPDGMPILWIARLLGIPLKARIAGSDMFEALKASTETERPLSVFFFGGPEGIAAAAAQALCAEGRGLASAGACFPGYGTVEDMSSEALCDAVNASNADLLVVSLGSAKGQSWLLNNHDRLRIPVRAHLGATINFQAGTIRRAPRVLRQLGFEWLWRIKEEPQLWRRYWHDGWKFLALVSTRIIPLAVAQQWGKRKYRHHDLRIRRAAGAQGVILHLAGAADARHVAKAIASFRAAAEAKNHVVLDLSAIRYIDARFLGLLLAFRKHLSRHQCRLVVTGATNALRRSFRLHGFDDLLAVSSRDMGLDGMSLVENER